MKMNNIKEIAKKLGVKPGAMNKQNLIRSIQEQEGYTACFNSEQISCDQYDCCWRSDCKPGVPTNAIEACQTTVFP